MKLNLGCGTDPKPGFLNVDFMELPGTDLVADLSDLAANPLDLPDDSVEEFLAIHFLEHLADPLPFMQEMWRLAEPEATFLLATPYGSSDDAWEDPTHVRPYFANSWAAFSQPYHWRSAGYGYTADWQVEEVVLQLRREAYHDVPASQAYADVQHRRNVVVQMVTVLRAVKPARGRDRALLGAPEFKLQLVDV